MLNIHVHMYADKVFDMDGDGLGFKIWLNPKVGLLLSYSLLEFLRFEFLPKAWI